MADAPDPVDVYVGNAIRALRHRAGISQGRLADAIGLTFQQVQKYERATNRVSCSMLARIAQHLNAPIETFFPPVDEAGVAGGLGAVERLAAASGGHALAEAFLSLPTSARPQLVKVAAAMAEAFAEEPGASYVTGGDTEASRHVA